MSSEFNFTDNQWYNFICGFHAGLKLKDLSLPEINSNRLLFPIGVGGWGCIGIGIPTMKYDGINTGMIPVFTHDVDINYSGFSVNLQWDSSRLRFDGVTEGQFGTIGDSSSSSDIRYTYSNGNFKARGIRDRSVVFNEPIILFYINVTIIDTVTAERPIKINLNSNNNTDLNYTTLLKWVDIGDDQWYNYFITPIANVSGAIVSEDSKDTNSSISPLGDEEGVSVNSSPSGVYIGTAFTFPGKIGVVPIYANSNAEDNFPYSGVHINFTVRDPSDLFDYIELKGHDDFSLSINRTSDENGYLVFDVVATRPEALIDNCTFCYIKYKIANIELDKYKITLHNNISELMN